jgi:hypothetical protein
LISLFNVEDKKPPHSNPSPRNAEATSKTALPCELLLNPNAVFLNDSKLLWLAVAIMILGPFRLLG